MLCFCAPGSKTVRAAIAGIDQGFEDDRMDRRFRAVELQRFAVSMAHCGGK
jgi:hypothetical protein